MSTCHEYFRRPSKVANRGSEPNNFYTVFRH